MTTWRVFIGDGGEENPDDADWSHVDQRYDDRAVAVARLRDALWRFATDSCETCRFDAAHVTQRLDQLGPDGELWDQIDGETYVVMRADRTDVADLVEEYTLAFQAVKASRP